MKKQIVSNRVLRGIAIAMSALMAITSVPVRSYAAGESTEENLTVSEAGEICDSIDEVTSKESSESASPIENDVNEAISATEKLENQQLSDTLNAIIEDSNIENTDESIDNVKEILVIVESKEKEAAEATGTLEETVSGLESNMDSFDEANKKANDNMTSLIDNIDTANNSDSRDEAYKAADEAKKNLDNINEGLATALQAYDEAGKEVKNAEKEYDEAKGLYDKAQKELDKAKSDLENAKTNTTAANERMKAAQAQLDLLDSRLEKLNENKAENYDKLKAIEDQYYALLINYYRNSIALGNGALYNDDGTLDVQGCAEAISDDKIKKMAEGPGDPTFNLGRDLLKKLVMYKSEKNEDIDWSTFEFGMTGIVGDAREGVVYKSSEKTEAGNPKDKVVVKEPNVKDVNGNKVNPSSNYYKYGMVKDKTSIKGGRANRVVVTYKDNAGNEHTEYYNYIFKNPEFDDVSNFETGPIYLAEVYKEGDTWKTKRDDSIYNFDDYQELTKIVEVLNNIDKYNEYKNDLENAKKAVDSAAAEVQKLTEEVERLQKVSVDTSKLQELEGRLAEAKERYTQAEEAKEVLENMASELEGILDKIDLSRFPAVATQNPQNDTDDSDEGDDSDDDASFDGGTVIPGTITFSNMQAPAGTEGLGTINTLTNNTGVLGVRVAQDNVGDADQGTVQIADDQVARAAVAPGGKTDNKKNVGQELQRIKNNEIPLADIPNMGDEVTMNWLWLLIIFLLGATGKKLYDEYKKKQEE